MMCTWFSQYRCCLCRKWAFLIKFWPCVYFGRGMSGIDYSQGEKIIIVTLVAYFQELVMVTPKNFRAARVLFSGGPLGFLWWAALRAEIVGREFYRPSQIVEPVRPWLPPWPPKQPSATLRASQLYHRLTLSQWFICSDLKEFNTISQIYFSLTSSQAFCNC